MSTKQKIEAIIAPAKAKGIDTGCEFNGKFWEVWVGSHAGGRENGESLARFLMERHEKATQRAQGEPEPIPIPAFLHVEDEPEPATPDPRLDLQAARIAELEAALAEAKATQEVSVPSDLSDLIETADTPYQTNEKLLARLREVLGLIGLAEDAGGRAAPELYKRRDRLESGIRWNRGRLAEQI